MGGITQKRIQTTSTKYPSRERYKQQVAHTAANDDGNRAGIFH